jgi:hypothetical protein
MTAWLRKVSCGPIDRLVGACRRAASFLRCSRRAGPSCWRRGVVRYVRQTAST